MLKQKSAFAFLCIMAMLMLASCKKFVDVGAPDTQIGAEEAFANNMTATSTILGLYAEGISGDQGLARYYSATMGNSADELQPNSSPFGVFNTNTVPVNSFYIDQYLWTSAYNKIMQANFAIARLGTSTSLSPAVKASLTGEAKFFRAFMYFYLVNMFGDVPMPLGTNVLDNAKLPRAAVAQVWTQLIADLKDAETLLPAAYAGTGFRVRINKAVAEAFLARVYLYQQDWANAERYASILIDNGDYQLLESVNINDVFNNASTETIWQVSNLTGVSSFGPLYSSFPGQVPTVSMTTDLYTSMDDTDLRKSNWTRQTNANGNEYYEIYKYKVRSGSGDEYDIVFRLAEQYLIRAEARARLNKITGPNSAVADVSSIRERAGLSASVATNLQEVLADVEEERRHELFGEFGHRWLDLKRTPGIGNSALTRADELLSVVKPSWKATAKLYPIPINQINVNSSLIQNPGYGTAN